MGLAVRPGASSFSLMDDPEACDCCDEPICCPAQLCDSLCFCLSNVGVTTVGDGETPVTGLFVGPYCVPIFFDGYGYFYGSQAITTTLSDGSTVQINLVGRWSCTPPAGTPSLDFFADWSIEVIGPTGVYGFSSNFGGYTALSTADCEDADENEITGLINPIETDYNGLITNLSGAYSVSVGDCGAPGEGGSCDSCDPYGDVRYCCGDGVDWFCGDGVHGTNDEMPLILNLTVTTSVSADLPVATVLQLSLFGGAQNGIITAYWPFSPGILNSNKYDFFLKCDGTIYQNVVVATGHLPSLTPVYIKQWTSVGGITAWTSCAPVQVTITLSAGPYAGTVFEVTE